MVRHVHSALERRRNQGNPNKSALGQTRKSGDAITTSALPPTADIPESGCEVRKVPTTVMFRPGRFGRPPHPSTMLRNVPTFDQQVASRVGCTDSLSP